MALIKKLAIPHADFPAHTFAQSARIVMKSAVLNMTLLAILLVAAVLPVLSSCVN